MCGIAGFTGVPHSDTTLAHRIAQVLQPRGPDDVGFLAWRPGTPPAVSRNPPIAPGLVFLHRRLAIIDTTDDGHQPMGTEDGRHFIVFNGEIYNYPELRNELEGLGWTFRSQSDTEVLLKAYVQWGTAALPRLRGMFALAILDVAENSLFLARDPFGIKPLYFATPGGGFAFASEIKALLALPGVSREVAAQPMFDYMRFGFCERGDQTLFRDIHRLPPAHYAIVPLDEPRRLSISRYWSLSEGRRQNISFGDAAERLRDLFLDSVRLHLRSDVPVGAALSGGIDSSAVVMAMRAVDPGGLDIHAFSYVADEKRLNEESWIDLVGTAAKAKVHKVRLTPEEMVADLDALIAVQDEPFGSTSIFAQSRVFALARQTGIKVTLDGQGADEMLSGYPTYYGARIASLVRDGRFTEALRLLRRAAATGNLGAGSILLRAGRHLLPDALQEPARRVVGENSAPLWLNRDWFEARGAATRAPPPIRDAEVLRGHLLESFFHDSLPALLRYADRNSMRHSVESRVPFLDVPLVEFVFSLPEHHLIDGNGVTKAVFRKAMRGLVPDAVLDRPDKIGFNTPQTRWLSAVSGYVDSVLSSPAAHAIPALNMPAIGSEWAKVKAGNQPFTGTVWRWINLIRWAELTGARF